MGTLIVSMSSPAGCAFGAYDVGTDPAASSNCNLVCRSDDNNMAEADGRSLGFSLSIDPMTLVRTLEYLPGMAG